MMKSLMGAVAMATLLATTSAQSQDFPDRPVTMVMPFSAGGPGETLARILAQSTTELLGQQVLIENAAGAGGTVGSAKVARADPDGYTLLITHISHATNPALYRKLKYDTLTDFVLIGLVADLPMTLVSRSDLGPKDFGELLTFLKENQDKVTYAHAGVGSASHLCGLLFMKAIETPIVTVPYKGSGPAMNDLLGGHVDFMCDQTVNTLSHIKPGSINVFGVTSKERIDLFPDVPTLEEAGLPSFEPNVWYGLYTPAGTPQPVIEKLTATLQEALASEKVKTQFADFGAQAVSPDKAQPEALQAQVEAEIANGGRSSRKPGSTRNSARAYATAGSDLGSRFA